MKKTCGITKKDSLIILQSKTRVYRSARRSRTECQFPTENAKQSKGMIAMRSITFGMAFGPITLIRTACDESIV